MTPIQLEDSEGCKVYHMKQKLPMIISNRSIITCFYQDELEDGTKILIHSSKGNEAITQSRSAEIGSDVVADMIIAYWAFKPYDGGFEIVACLSMDPAGWIIEWVKKKMAARMANSLQI